MEGTPFGRYRLLDQLGRGGMGEVWRAHDSAIDRVVALKMLLPHYAKDPDFETRFRREALAAARLDEPHVVPIHDVGEIDGRLYVTMRLINGTDLQALLDAGPLAPGRAVHIVEQIASALHSAHRVGLVHRDVKPSNILVAENDFAYLIDFGIARSTDDTGLTSEGSTIGTWAYMAPERFSAGTVAPSSDVYALACVLYQSLTGELPFPGNTLEQVAVSHMVMPPPRPSVDHPTVPTALDGVIATGLAKKPDDRYPTAIDMAAAARQAISAPSYPSHVVAPTDPLQTRRQPVASAMPPPTLIAPPAGPPVAPPEPPAVRRRRSRVALIASVIAAVLVVAGGTLTAVTLLGQRDRTATAPPAGAAAVGANFTGTYRADYGPGTDMAGKPAAGAPATTTTWGVRSSCGPSGCVATASIIGGGGIVLLSNLIFDQIGGSWVAVGLASAPCTEGSAETWVTFTLEPQPDGSLTGETVRATSSAGCLVKRTVKFTRTGDPDVARVPDPAVLPPRATSAATALRGTYRESLAFANGNSVQDEFAVHTDCLRTGDRCLSLFHAGDGVVTLIFADGKWTRSESGMTPCPHGGTAQMSVDAVYSLPVQLDDPIPVLTGTGTQTVAPGGACTGGGAFTDTYERMGD